MSLGLYALVSYALRPRSLACRGSRSVAATGHFVRGSEPGWTGNFRAVAMRRCTSSIILLIAVFLWAGCAGHLRCSPEEEVSALAPSAPPRQVRIATVNVWSGLTCNGVLSVRRQPDDPEAR